MSRSWRHSLRFRTTAIAVFLTALSLLVVFLTMSFLVQTNLFNSRQDQALVSARTAASDAQAALDAADIGGDRSKMFALMSEVQSRISRLAAADGFALRRLSTDQPTATTAQEFQTAGFSDDIITPAMRQNVSDKPGTMWVQSVALTDADGGIAPGLLIGQQLTVPEAGKFALYITYDLTAAQATLSFLQGALWVTGIVLLGIIGVISWFVLRQVTVPIEQAAETSERLAEGDLGVRLDVRGESEIATLGRSFNAMADSLEGQIKELAELSLVQQRFVSDVSHELRTPLTTIKLASDMLNDSRDDFDPTTARTAELLHDQVERFETLLTDLLEISRYDAGSVQLDMEATSLAHLAEDVVEQMRPLAQQHDSDLRFVAPGGYSPVDMDPRRVRRVVRNLVGNAIEHGEGGPIVVTVDSDQDAVAIGVRDFGLGMRAEDTQRVFDRFWRADPSRKRTIGGTGLGLSIALGDARLHHGTLTVWSEQGVGTNFVLTLPRRSGVSPTHSPVPLEPAETTAALDALGMTEPIRLPRAEGTS
ncbi:MtrAB system histidine kinase MtrB [Microbacterium gorillae]|uniref:MtrAB system histidine kinase MtrB n=1 Tax=Microbacterium gorillae TaxID=1231063 RepID=UPI000B9C1A5F|nr:MtrAB system histidine kinase MtrB [Microbacterium gorillae]